MVRVSRSGSSDGSDLDGSVLKDLVPGELVLGDGGLETREPGDVDMALL